MEFRSHRKAGGAARLASVLFALACATALPARALGQEVPHDLRERVVATLTAISRVKARARKATGSALALSRVLEDPEVAGPYQALTAYYRFEERRDRGGRFLVLARPRSGVPGAVFTLREDLRVRQLAGRSPKRQPNGVRPASPAEARAVSVLKVLAAAENACFEKTGRYQGLPELVAGGFLEERYLEPGALAPGYRFYLTAASYASYQGWKAEPLAGTERLRALWVTKNMRVRVEAAP